MINVPKNLCKCDTVSGATGLTQIPPLDICYITQCGVVEPVELVPILNTLCPCDPIPEIVVNFNPEPRRTRIVRSCFTDFIKNMTSTKFCNVGPSCQVS